MADILVVIDHPVIGLDLWDMLQNDGHDVRHVTSSEAAMAALSRRQPDLIVTDHAMPSVDGRTFVGALRADAGLAHIPVIQVGHAAVCRPDGVVAAGYIRKPWSQVALLNAIARLTAVDEESGSRLAG